MAAVEKAVQPVPSDMATGPCRPVRPCGPARAQWRVTICPGLPGKSIQWEGAPRQSADCLGNMGRHAAVEKAVQPVPPVTAAGPRPPVDFGVVLWYTGGKETKNAAAPGSGDSRKACNGIGKYPAQQEFLHRFISITVLQCFHEGRESQAWRFPLAVCLRGRKRGGLWSIVIHMLRG